MFIARVTVAAALLGAVALPVVAQAPADSVYQDRKSGLLVHSVSEPPANLPTLRTLNPTDRAWVVVFRAPVGPSNESTQWDVGLVLPHDSMSMRVDTRGAAPTAITIFKATAPDSSHFWNLFWEANESALRNGTGLYPGWLKSDVVAFFANPVDAPYAAMAAAGHRAFMRVMKSRNSPVSPEIADIVVTAKPAAVAPPRPSSRPGSRRKGVVTGAPADMSTVSPRAPSVDISGVTPASPTATAAVASPEPQVAPPVAAPVTAPVTAPTSTSVSAPVTAPVTAPTSTSVSAPVTAPVTAAPVPIAEAPVPLAVVPAEQSLGDTAAFGWRAYARPPVAVISASGWLFDRPMPRFDKRSLTDVGAQGIMDVVIGSTPVPPMDRGTLLREWKNRWNDPTGDWIEEQVVTRANEAPAPAPTRGSRGKPAPAAPARAHVTDLKALFAADGRAAIRLLDDAFGLVQETP